MARGRPTRPTRRPSPTAASRRSVPRGRCRCTSSDTDDDEGLTALAPAARPARGATAAATTSERVHELADPRDGTGAAVTTFAGPQATLLMMASRATTCASDRTEPIGEEIVETFDDWKLIFAEPDSSPLPGGRSATSHTPGSGWSETKGSCRATAAAGGCGLGFWRNPNRRPCITLTQGLTRKALRCERPRNTGRFAHTATGIRTHPPRCGRLSLFGVLRARALCAGREWTRGLRLVPGHRLTSS